MSRHLWLVKSEPSVFAWDDLWASVDRRTCWDGVRNDQARNFMRDEMKVGDGVLFAHSRTDPPAVVGVATVCREAYPGPTQFDPSDAHFDPRSEREAPRWMMVDIEAARAFTRAVPLAQIRANRKLAKMALVQRGQRLSVQPVTPRTVARGTADGRPGGVWDPAAAQAPGQRKVKTPAVAAP